MVNYWTAKSIESDNFWWMIISLFVAFRVAVLWHGGHISEELKRVCIAFLFAFLGSGLNHGWFATSRHFAPPGEEKWNQAMFEWRWLMVMLTALSFTWGCVSFLQIIEEFSDTHKFWLMLLSYGLSRFMGFY